MNTSRLLTDRQRARLLPRSMWVAILYLMLSFISVIGPKVARPLTEQQREARRRGYLIRLRERFWVRDRLDATKLSLRQQLGRELGCVDDRFDLPLPDIDDILVLSYGIPVLPWLKRIGVLQWKVWLDHLGMTMRARYPDRAEIALGPAWDAWLQEHVRYVEAHFSRLATQRLAKVVSTLPPSPGELYLFGHSAGGTAVLHYLADLRDGLFSEPARRIKAALALNSAVAGPARAWTGWPLANERPSRLDRLRVRVRKYIKIDGDRPQWHRHITWSRDYMELPFRGLGAWAHEEGFTLLTVNNMADLFCHKPLDDIPFVAMYIGSRRDIKGIYTGRTHLHIQRDPRVPHFLWWHDDVSMPDGYGW